MEGVANLFDVAMVFAVGLLVALISAYSLLDMLDPTTEVTILKKRGNGQLEMVIKKGREIKVERLTGRQLQGEGVRLGVAYRLRDGRVIYVPEEEEGFEGD